MFTFLTFVKCFYWPSCHPGKPVDFAFLASDIFRLTEKIENLVNALMLEATFSTNLPLWISAFTAFLSF